MGRVAQGRDGAVFDGDGLDGAEDEGGVLGGWVGVSRCVLFLFCCFIVAKVFLLFFAVKGKELLPSFCLCLLLSPWSLLSFSLLVRFECL